VAEASVTDRQRDILTRAYPNGPHDWINSGTAGKIGAADIRDDIRNEVVDMIRETRNGERDGFYSVRHQNRLVKFFADDQPRVPAGSPEGGEFAGKDGSGGTSASAKVSALRAQYPVAPAPANLAMLSYDKNSPEAIAHAQSQVVGRVEKAFQTLSREGVATLPSAYPTIDERSAHYLIEEAGTLRYSADMIGKPLERDVQSTGFKTVADEMERGPHGQAITHAKDLVANARDTADKQMGRAAQFLADKAPDDAPILEPDRNAIGNALIFHPEDLPEHARAGIMALADKGTRYDVNVSGCIVLKDEGKTPAGKALREINENSLAYRPVRLSGESTYRQPGSKGQTGREQQIGRLWEKSQADVKEHDGKQYKVIAENVALSKKGDRYQVIDASKVPAEAQ
jgi:hypothetical protein